MQFVRLIGKFVADVGIPTVVDIVAAKQRQSDGGRKITPAERDEITGNLTRRGTDFVVGLLPL